MTTHIKYHCGASNYSMTLLMDGKKTVIAMENMSKQGRADLMLALMDWRYDGYKGYPAIAEKENQP